MKLAYSWKTAIFLVEEFMSEAVQPVPGTEN